MMLARYKKIANFTFLARWANLAVLEFLRHPELDPLTSWFSCCLRLDDLAGFYAHCEAAGIPEATKGYPRLHAPQAQEWGGTMAALIDLDGTLLRLIANR